MQHHEPHIKIFLEYQQFNRCTPYSIDFTYVQRPTLDLLFQLPLSSDVLQPFPGCRIKSGRKFTGLRPAESVRDLVLRPVRRPDRVRDHDRLHDREVPDEGRKDCHSSLAVRPGKTGHGNGQIDQDETSESPLNV